MLLFRFHFGVVFLVCLGDVDLIRPSPVLYVRIRISVGADVPEGPAGAKRMGPGARMYVRTGQGIVRKYVH
jgi:hypothetical protein